MKTTIYFLLTLVFLTAASCTVDVPDIDAVAPKFSFQIRGDGFNHTFMSGDDLSSVKLNLKKGAVYNFTFIGSDAGGLQDLLWNYEDDLVSTVDIAIAGGLPENWYKTTHYDHDFDFYPFVDGIRFKGDIADPLSGTILTGTFMFDSYSQDTYPNSFDFIARDFGGVTENPNSVMLHLSVLLGDHPTALLHVE